MLLFATLYLFACDSATEVGLGEGQVSTERVIEEGTPEALGVLSMLHAASTTVPVLDVDAALDKRAATNLMAHRNGADGRLGTSDDDLFQTIAEVDAVAFVGDSALSALLGYAADNGWIAVDEDYYGTIETVSFTNGEAAGVVALANTASQAVLDDAVGLDSRAAAGIVAKRPFTKVEQVAAAPYVGASALNRLKEHAATSPTTADIVAALDAAVDGLWYTSESDYPLTTFDVASPSSTTVSASNVVALVGGTYTPRADVPSLSARTIEASSLSWMFDRYTVTQSWWDESQLADQPRWQRVRDVFEQDLSNVTVWRFGRRNSSGDLVGDIDVLAVGVTPSGDLVGVWTIVVET